MSENNKICPIKKMIAEEALEKVKHMTPEQRDAFEYCIEHINDMSLDELRRYLCGWYFYDSSVFIFFSMLSIDRFGGDNHE